MQSILIWYNNEAVKADLSKINTTIYESWRFKTVTDMTKIIEELREKSTDKEAAICTLGTKEMIREWRSHNLLYTLGLFRTHTEDVDLNTDNPWYLKVAYAVVSPFYSLFT